MQKDTEALRGKVQDVIRHLVKQGVANLDKDVLERLAGDSAKEVKAQLDALLKSDGCYCPDPPHGCHC